MQCRETVLMVKGTGILPGIHRGGSARVSRGLSRVRTSLATIKEQQTHPKQCARQQRIVSGAMRSLRQIMPPLVQAERRMFTLFAKTHDSLKKTDSMKELDAVIARKECCLKKAEWGRGFDPRHVPQIRIAGAGFAGLALAVMLLKNGVPASKIKVIEARSKEEACVRPNNVQLRDDYREEDAFVLLESLRELLTEEQVQVIREIGICFGNSNEVAEDGLPKSRFIISVGYVQKLLLETIPEQCMVYDSPQSDQDLQRLSDAGAEVFDCRGPQRKAVVKEVEGMVVGEATRSTTVYETGEAIDTEHVWQIDLSNTVFPKREYTGTRTGFISFLHRDWTGKQDSHAGKQDRFFSANLLRRSMRFLTNRAEREDGAAREKTVQRVEAMRHCLAGINSGEITEFSGALCHRKLNDTDFDHKIDREKVSLTYSLKTRPNFTLPSKDVFSLGDALAKPHPYAAHGMFGVFKGVASAGKYVRHLGMGLSQRNAIVAKRLLQYELLKTGLYQMGTLETMRAYMKR